MNSEPVEIVDEISAHECLQGLVNLRQVHALLEGLVTVHFHIELRHGWQESSADAGDLGPLARRLHEFGDVARQKRNILAGTVLKDESEAARCADALDGGRRKGKSNRSRQLGKLLVQVGLDGFIALFRFRAFAPILQAYPDKSAVSIA